PGQRGEEVREGARQWRGRKNRKEEEEEGDGTFGTNRTPRLQRFAPSGEKWSGGVTEDSRAPFTAAAGLLDGRCWSVPNLGGEVGGSV
uniref:Uncharacterized protein n=1 Tax=Oryza punctata TaxID=4537 RepID=A0A0E0M6N5_ORYPU